MIYISFETELDILEFNRISLKRQWKIINNSKFNFISVPEIEIVDERDKPVKEKFYKGGSTIELKCIVKQIVGQAPEYIIWHHGNRMLNYDIERGGIR